MVNPDRAARHLALPEAGSGLPRGAGAAGGRAHSHTAPPSGAHPPSFNAGRVRRLPARSISPRECPPSLLAVEVSHLCGRITLTGSRPGGNRRFDACDVIDR